MNKTQTNQPSTDVTAIAEKMENGKFFMQDPNFFGKPTYAQNAVSSIQFNGINELKVVQAAYENNKKPVVITFQQCNEKRGQIKKDSKALTVVAYENFNAKYKKDEEIKVTEEMVQNGTNKYVANGAIVDAKVGEIIHKPGELKINDKGLIEEEFKYGLVFAAEDAVKTEVKVLKNEDGTDKRYTQNVYAKDKNGNILTYTADRYYPNENDEPRSYKKGEPVVLHEAGTKIKVTVPTDKSLFKMKDQVKKSNNAVPYIPLNNSARETFYAKLVEGFNAMYTGAIPQNNKIDFTKDEIQYVKNELANHPRQFNGIVKSAQNRAIADEANAKLNDTKRAEKIEAQQTQNQNKVETKKTSKKR